MPRSFSCPSCGAPLDYSGSNATIRCTFCNASVIVPPELRGAAPEPDAEPEAPAPDVAAMAGQLAEILRLAQSGRKIEAIKLYRQLSGVGLKEAKDAVEAAERGEPLRISRTSVTSQTTVSGAGAAPSRAAQIAEIGRLIQGGNKIEAIKRYREIFGVGLKEAKDAIDRLESTAGTPGAFDLEPPVVVVGERPRAPSRPQQKKRGFPWGAVLTALALGVFMLMGATRGNPAAFFASLRPTAPTGARWTGRRTPCCTPTKARC